MNDDKMVSRRNILKSTVFGSLAGFFVAVNPVKLLGSQKNEIENKLKVKIHPLAIKRNNKDKS